MRPERPAAILDLDGTLVDSNYHHALAWYRAFREQTIVLPLWRLHRHVGMGGDKYVAAVAGDEVERRLGDQLRKRWEKLFNELLPEVEPAARRHRRAAKAERGTNLSRDRPCRRALTSIPRLPMRAPLPSRPRHH